MIIRDQIDEVITFLIAIKEFSKDIHYTCHGDAFYAKHLLVDKFDFNESIDLLKECCLLGNGDRPLSSKEYLEKATTLLIKPNENDDIANFKNLAVLLDKILERIDSIETDNRADSSILDSIAQDLQQYKGLVNLQLY